MRFNPYDDVQQKSVTFSSIAIQSLTGSSPVTSDYIDTVLDASIGGAESLLLHVRAEIASGSPSAATVAVALQESTASGSGFAAADDNTGTAIGATLTVTSVAQDYYVRIEGINLQNTSLTSAPKGGRQRYLKVVLTPSFSSGSSPAILAYAELIGAPGNGAQLPVRTVTSNT